MRLAVLALLVACGDPTTSEPRDAASDAPATGVMYELLTSHREPRLDPHPTTYIDGMMVDHVVAFYPTQERFAAASHTVELRSGAAVLSQLTIDAAVRGTCSGVPVPTSVQDVLCVLDHGELRFASTTIRGDGGVCVGDGFCLPRCFPGDEVACPEDQHCTARVTSRDPLYTRMDCAPVGARTLGQTCAAVDDPAGAYDDCARGLICLGGTCRALCTAACSDCPAPARYPDEIRVCP